MTRAAELAGRLAAVRARIDDAARAAGRDPAAITLVAVSKTYPQADVAVMSGLGVRDFGESRHQEAAPKAAGFPQLRWHFLGRIQTNKARQIAGYADLVHALDRAQLVAPLARGAHERGRLLAVLIQVSLDGDPARGGVSPGDVPALADAIGAEPQLRLEGLMGLAPQRAAPRPAFARLRNVHAQLLRDHPAATTVSAGMSADLEAAIAEGATLVRVGSALFGARPPASG